MHNIVKSYFATSCYQYHLTREQTTRTRKWIVQHITNAYKIMRPRLGVASKTSWYSENTTTTWFVIWTWTWILTNNMDMFSTPKLEDVKISTLQCKSDVNKLKTNPKIIERIKEYLPGESSESTASPSQPQLTLPTYYSPLNSYRKIRLDADFSLTFLRLPRGPVRLVHSGIGRE